MLPQTRSTHSSLSLPASPSFTLHDAWQEGSHRFLDSRRTINTRRSYEFTLREFFAYAGIQPWDITPAIVQDWVESLRQRQLSHETINAKVAALSSYYHYMVNDYHVRLPNGEIGPLCVYNPAAAKSLRAKVNPYGKSRYLSAMESRALLSSIDRSSVQGLRDYALFLTYLATGRRNSEARLLKWGDFEDKDGRVYYRWSGKGHSNVLNEMPLRVWNTIQDWLKASGRLGSIQDSDYIFIALSTNGARIPRVQSRPVVYDPASEPISSAQVGALLKKYCRLAGLDPSKVHPHTLRHTAAMLRKEAGDDIEKICSFLGHSNVAITQVYVKSVEGKKDTSWSTVEALLGL